MELLIRKPGTARPTHDEGDVFGVYPDGSLPEAPAPDSVFWRVLVPGVLPNAWQHLLERGENNIVDPRILGQRRVRKLDWTRVPAAILTELESTRTITISSNNFKAAWIAEKP